MALSSVKLSKLFHRSSLTFIQFSSAHSSSLQESIRSAVQSKSYQQIPDILNDSKDHFRNPNPFSFLSNFPKTHQIQTIDEILQSLIPLRPRHKSFFVYSCLLSYTLETSNNLPLALAVVQRTLRSGCVPAPQNHLLLSNSWLERRTKPESLSSILSEMRSIGYYPDSGTCNYLIMSLCKVDKIEEAVKVLKGMGQAGCVPDLDSFGILIGEMSELRRTGEVIVMLKEMVCKHRLNPRQEVVIKAVGAMRANREVWRAVEMIEFLESENVEIGFEVYESVLKSCLEGREFVLAGKVVIRMTGRGFIPYISVRQKVVEGLFSVGESELAAIVRQRFEKLKS